MSGSSSTRSRVLGVVIGALVAVGLSVVLMLVSFVGPGKALRTPLPDQIRRRSNSRWSRVENRAIPKTNSPVCLALSGVRIVPEKGWYRARTITGKWAR